MSPTPENEGAILRELKTITTEIQSLARLAVNIFCIVFFILIALIVIINKI